MSVGLITGSTFSPEALTQFLMPSSARSLSWPPTLPGGLGELLWGNFQGLAGQQVLLLST